MISVRRVELPTDGVPKHWCLGSAVLTHLTNAMFLLFPEGERFFVRQTRRALKYVRRPELLHDVEAFIAQEAQHAREHKRFFSVFDAHGLPYQPMLERAARLLEKFDALLLRGLGEAGAAKVTLALVAAFEHYTASWGGLIFGDLHSLDEMDPRMRALLLWHFAEELEHKHVAFEMLREFSDSYALRAAGMWAATLALCASLTLVTLRLLLTDDEVTGRRLVAEVIQFLRYPDNLAVSGLKSFLNYHRPGFHPDDIAHPEAARAWLAEFEAAGHVKSQKSA